MKRIAVSGLVATMVFTALPAAAQERGYYSLGGGQRPGSEFFTSSRGHERIRDGVGFDQRRGDRTECSTDTALSKARRMGMRGPHIANANRRTIKIVGRLRGERIWLIFARAPRCFLVGQSSALPPS